MIKILNESVISFRDDIEDKYPNCKFLLIDIDKNNLQNLNGKLYCISTNKDSFDELMSIYLSFRHKGILCSVCGFYEGGMAIGLFSEIKG